MSKFDELLGELETLAKAQPAENGDDKIVAAAAEGGGQVDGDKDKDDKDDGMGDNPMAKSFEVTLADGTKVQAQDGTELVKALHERIDSTETTMAKALETAIGLIKSQGEQIAALGGKVKALSGEGKGRKAVLTVTEKPAAGGLLAKSQEPEGITPEQFMAKALDAQKLGRLTGLEVSVAEAHLNRGQQVPAEIVRKVAASA